MGINMGGHDYLTVLWYVLGAWWVLFALAVAAIVHQWMRVEQNPLSRLPGTRISKWSSIPNWIELFRGTQPAYVHSLFEKYGPVVRVAPNQVCFWDMSALNQIYSLDEKFAKSYLHQDFTGGGPGSSSVGSSAEAAEHKRHRAKLEPLLAESAVARLYPAVNAKVKLAIQRIGEETEREGSSDVFKWWTLAMADISGELILGQSFGVLETGQSNEIVQELQDGSILALVNLILPYITPLAEYVSLGPVTRGCSARKRTFERSKEMLDKHKEAVRSAQPDQLPPSIFANLFAEQQQQSAEKGGSDLEQLEIISNAVTFIANGTETTANTLTYLIWAVCRHPEARMQLLEEIESLAGVPEVTDQHLRRLAYLNQVVEETLRLYPAVAGGLLRTVPAEGAEIAGHWIPGGTTVSCQAYSMHRDPKIFPNPNVFYPERWAEPTPEMRMAMMAWGGGARTCLGIHLARMELRLGAVHFFHAFPQARTSTVAGMSDADMEPEMVSFTAPKGHRCLIECK